MTAVWVFALTENRAQSCLTKPHVKLWEDRVVSAINQWNEASDKCDLGNSQLAELNHVVEEMRDERIWTVRGSYLSNLIKVSNIHALCNRPLLALEAYAPIYSELYGILEERYLVEFANYLLKVNEQNVSSLLQSLYSKIKHKNQGQATDAAIKLFNALQELRAKNTISTAVAEASVVYVVELFQRNLSKSAARSLLQEYRRNESSLNDAPLVRFTYVKVVLRSIGRGNPTFAQQALDLLEPLAQDERFRFSMFYNVLSSVYLDLGQPNHAERILSEARELYDDRYYTNVNNLAGLYLIKGESSKAADLMIELLKQKEGIELQGLSYARLRRHLIFALQSVHRDDEAMRYISEAQLEVFTRRSAQITQIKQEISLHRQRWDTRVVQAKAAVPKRSELLVKGPPSTVELPAFIPETEKGIFRAKDVLPTQKEKVKTRKAVTEVSVGAETPRGEAASFVELKTVEELLGDHKNALEVFYRFFRNYEDQSVRVSAIDISMSELESLMGALGQDFDPTKGKGSHKKITLTRNSLQPNLADAAEETMLILSNKTKLNGAQIAHIRDSFIELYLFPTHLKDTLLKKNKLLF